MLGLAYIDIYSRILHMTSSCFRAVQSLARELMEATKIFGTWLLILFFEWLSYWVEMNWVSMVNTAFQSWQVQHLLQLTGPFTLCFGPVRCQTRCTVVAEKYSFSPTCSKTQIPSNYHTASEGNEHRTRVVYAFLDGDVDKDIRTMITALAPWDRLDRPMSLWGRKLLAQQFVSWCLVFLLNFERNCFFSIESTALLSGVDCPFLLLKWVSVRI